MYPIFFRLPSWLPFMGDAPITSFGVFMFLSFLTGGILLRSEMERTGHDPDRAWDLVFMGVLGGVIGAKAYYVLLNYEALLANPLAATRPSSFSLTGDHFLGLQLVRDCVVRHSCT